MVLIWILITEEITVKCILNKCLNKRQRKVRLQPAVILQFINGQVQIQVNNHKPKVLVFCLFVLQ